MRYNQLMVELERQREELPAFPLKDRHRIFPPTGNKTRLENVMDGFRKIIPFKNEEHAPWVRSFIPAELPSAVSRFEQAGKDLFDSLENISPDNSPNKSLVIAKILLRNEISRLSSNDGDYKDINEAEYHALTHVVERWCKGTDLGSYYRREGRSTLPPSTKEVVKTAQSFFVWETIKDASEMLSSYPNPFENILDLYELGANRVKVSDEGVLIVMKVNTDDRIARVPYLIERE